MKTITMLSFDLQHKLASGLIAMGFRGKGCAYKQRLDERLTFTLTKN